jgi:hypothetical protein
MQLASIELVPTTDADLVHTALVAEIRRLRAALTAISDIDCGCAAGEIADRALFVGEGLVVLPPKS